VSRTVKSAGGSPVRTSDRGLHEFSSFTLAHPHLVAAREALMSALGTCAGNTIIFVVGPTGVGKTVVLQKDSAGLRPNQCPLSGLSSSIRELPG
jgi:Cdc6-like AAA superfamily ATPase